MADPTDCYGAYLSVDGISDYQKIWITQGNICVIGYIGEGTSREIVSNWDAPFADTSLESQYRLAAGLAQVTSSATTASKLTSRQVWVGNQPYTFNLTLKFRAFYDDAVQTDPGKIGRQVSKAIQQLEIMMAPNLEKDLLPGINSRIPGSVDINVGREVLLLDCCIKSMSTPLDKERDKQGRLMRADVSLMVETLNALTQADLIKGFADANANVQP